MGGNASPKVPGRSLEHRTFLIFFSPQTEKEHEIVVFYSLLRGKDTTLFTPVDSGLPQEPEFGCGRPEQIFLGTALSQKSDLLWQSDHLT